MSSVCSAGHASSDDDYCSVCGVPIDPVASGAAPTPLIPPPGVAVPIPGGLQPPAPPAPASPGATLCPNCSTENVADALFCEACGYDFTTGTLPRPGAASSDAGQVAGTPAPDAHQSGAASASTAPPPAPGSAEDLPWASGARSTFGSGPAGEGAEAAPAPGGTAEPAAAHVAEIWIDPAWYDVQQSPDPLPSPGPPGIVLLRGTSVLVGRASRSRGIAPEVDCEPDSGVSRRQAQLTTDGTRWFVEDLDSANGTFVGAAGAPLPVDPIRVGSKHELQPGERIYVGAWTRIVIRPATEDELP